MMRKGQASLVMILLIGLVAITSAIASGSLSATNVQIEETIHTSDQAWYAAWAGVDELMLRLRAGQNFGASFGLNLTLPNNATASAVISGDNNQKTVKSTGFAGGFIKNIQITVVPSSKRGQFAFGILAGQGGLEIANSSTVNGASGRPGNVYSNGDVRGDNSNENKIFGNAWVTGSIRGLTSPTTGGVYIQKNASANSLTKCVVGGDVLAPQPPTNCPFSGTYQIAPAPSAVSLPDFDIAYWKNKAEVTQIWNGNCVVLSGTGTDCTNGTGKLGYIKILGDVTIPQDKTLTLTGSIWIKGNLITQNAVTFKADESLGTTPAIIIASDPDNPTLKGKITVVDNVHFVRNSLKSAFVLISERQTDSCSDPAISDIDNTTDVAYVALNGCVYAANNAFLIGVVGKKVHIEDNTSITFDPSMARAAVDTTIPGWAVTNVKEY